MDTPRKKHRKGRPPKGITLKDLPPALLAQVYRLADAGLKSTEIDRRLGLSKLGVGPSHLCHSLLARKRRLAAREPQRSITAAATALLAFLEALPLPDGAVKTIAGRMYRLQLDRTTKGAQ